MGFTEMMAPTRGVVFGGGHSVAPLQNLNPHQLARDLLKPPGRIRLGNSSVQANSQFQKKTKNIKEVLILKRVCMNKSIFFLLTCYCAAMHSDCPSNCNCNATICQDIVNTCGSLTGNGSCWACSLCHALGKDESNCGTEVFTNDPYDGRGYYSVWFDNGTKYPYCVDFIASKAHQSDWFDITNYGEALRKAHPSGWVQEPHGNVEMPSTPCNSSTLAEIAAGKACASAAAEQQGFQSAQAVQDSQPAGGSLTNKYSPNSDQFDSMGNF
jgi:hypothetical protein